MPQPLSDPVPAVRPRPLPVTILPGMPVVEIEAGEPAVVAGITQEYCIYRLAQTDTLAVARWRDVALGNLCPADPLLPADVTQRDRGNAQAAVLLELLNLQQFGLTNAQTVALSELVAQLCGKSTE